MTKEFNPVIYEYNSGEEYEPLFGKVMFDKIISFTCSPSPTGKIWEVLLRTKLEKQTVCILYDELAELILDLEFAGSFESANLVKKAKQWIEQVRGEKSIFPENQQFINND